MIVGLATPDDITMPVAQLWDNAKTALYQPLLGFREIL